MDSLLNKSQPEVRIRAFRAIDDPGACELFTQGHERVLTSIGVTKVTSSNNAWISNPGSFVLIVESLDKTKVFGGARVHVAGGTEELPLEQATVTMDPDIRAVISKAAAYGTGEICGLWNSREIAGYGIGSIFLFRAAMAICAQIGLTSLFGLCAPYTLKMAMNAGFGILQSVGNNGTFYYPKLDLLATAVYNGDLYKMAQSTEEDRTAITKLRERLNVTVLEELRKKQMTIHYNLEIPSLEEWDLQATIANAAEQFKAASKASLLNEPNVRFL